MNKFEIAAVTRADRGKGASRRLRREGKLPGVLYGGHADPVAITLDHNEVLLQTAHEAFYSHILTLKLDGKTERVVVKDMQRHVYKPRIHHMDLLRVSETEVLNMRVQSAEEVCAALFNGEVKPNLPQGKVTATDAPKSPAA